MVFWKLELFRKGFDDDIMSLTFTLDIKMMALMMTMMIGGDFDDAEDDDCVCRNFQRGLCQEAHDHWGEFYGEQRYLRHICAKCWLQTRKKSPHSEDSDTCPLKE